MPPALGPKASSPDTLTTLSLWPRLWLFKTLRKSVRPLELEETVLVRLGTSLEEKPEEPFEAVDALRNGLGEPALCDREERGRGEEEE